MKKIAFFPPLNPLYRDVLAHKPRQRSQRMTFAFLHRE
jgi:hypothetical protein